MLCDSADSRSTQRNATQRTATLGEVEGLINATVSWRLKPLSFVRDKREEDLAGRAGGVEGLAMPCRHKLEFLLKSPVLLYWMRKEAELLSVHTGPVGTVEAHTGIKEDNKGSSWHRKRELTENDQLKFRGKAEGFGKVEMGAGFEIRGGAYRIIGRLLRKKYLFVPKMCGGARENFGRLPIDWTEHFAFETAQKVMVNNAELGDQMFGVAGLVRRGWWSCGCA
ncbi:hypothetical protein BDZ91DRAFT_768345 [Kalaharituber pfeilii]|nr:hypothetical protein BDZ91DRAFT_768345 [Kalaharituber pfeilii]